MREVLRIRRSYRNLGAIALLFVCGMAAASAYVAVAEALDGQRIFLVCFFLGFGGLSITLSILMLLTYWRESLTVEDGRIIQRGIIFTREIRFSEIVEIRWQAAGRLALRVGSPKINVDFGNFERHQQRLLIRLLRSSLRHAVHRGWETFCLRVALPLTKSELNVSLADDEVLITRRRWDWYFLPPVLALAVVAPFCAWYFRKPVCLLIPIALVLPWILLRLTFPVEGLRLERIEKKMPGRGYFWFWLVWSMVGIVGFMIFPALARHLAHPSAWGTISLVLWFAVFLVGGHRADRRRQHDQQWAARAAAEEWERLEGLQTELGDGR